MAFKLARRRRRKVTSVDKHNVMESSILWKRNPFTTGAQARRFSPWAR
ncbi:isocitrate/isopropylmalate family dehydrogenase [Acetomicrobium sp. S15 = DSM 107314]